MVCLLETQSSDSHTLDSEEALGSDSASSCHLLP